VLAFFLLNVVILAVSIDIKGQLHTHKYFKLIKYLKINRDTVFIQCFPLRCLFFSNTFTVWHFYLVVMLSNCHGQIGFSQFCFWIVSCEMKLNGLAALLGEETAMSHIKIVVVLHR